MVHSARRPIGFIRRLHWSIGRHKPGVYQETLALTCFNSVPLDYKYPRTGWKCGKEGPLVRRRSGQKGGVDTFRPDPPL